MLHTIQNAFRVKEIRNRIFFTIFILVIARIGCQLPLPGVNRSILEQMFAGLQESGLGFFNAMTGSSLSNMSIFALNVTVYITASIIMQLLTMAIPRLEEMQKDGESGREKMSRITRYLAGGLALLESTALVIGFGRQDVFGAEAGFSRTFLMIANIFILTAGAMAVVWLGDQITVKGVGNGISLILLCNILSTMPGDFVSLYEQFVKNAVGIGNAVLAAVIILALFVGMIILVIYLTEGERRIRVQYSQKISGRHTLGGQSSMIPLKANTAGVIPIIFAASVFQLPVIIGSIVNHGNIPEWAKYFSTSYWFHTEQMQYTAGFVGYLLLIVFFAYYYTQITFNPVEVADNIKKQGGTIPGIRAGKPTADYFAGILKYLIFIGAAGLCIVAAVPLAVSGIFRTSLSFAGTSLIIVVGVVIETAKAIESMLLGRNYTGFLKK